MGLVNATFTSNPLTLPANLAWSTDQASSADPAEIVRIGLAQADRPVLTTNFRPGAAALIHLVTRACPSIPVVWVDTGYNTPGTYRYVDALVARLDFDLHVYTPRLTVARQAAHGGVPASSDPAFAQFTREMKLEPFERAFNELKPDVWFTGVRAEHNAYRAGLGVFSRGAGNTLRVAPFHRWQAADVAAYLALHDLPDNDDYVDPTKPGQHLECGLQLLR